MFLLKWFRTVGTGPKKFNNILMVDLHNWSVRIPFRSVSCRVEQKMAWAAD